MSLRSVLLLRCPRCREGKVYEGLLKMRKACPDCGLPLEREPGFFLGAMYFSYALAILAALPVCLTLFFKGVDPLWNGLAGAGVITLISPLLVRYSRVIWLHFDQRFDPR